MSCQQTKSLYGVTIVMLLLFCNFAPIHTLNGSTSSLLVDKVIIPDSNHGANNNQAQPALKDITPSQNNQGKVDPQAQIYTANLDDRIKAIIKPIQEDSRADDQAKMIAQGNIAKSLSQQSIKEKTVSAKEEPNIKTAGLQDDQGKILNSFNSIDKQKKGNSNNFYQSKKEVQSFLSIFWRQLQIEFNNLDKNKINQIENKQSFDEKSISQNQPAQALYSTQEAIKGRKQKRKEFVFITIVFGILSLVFIKIAKISQEAHQLNHLRKEETCQQHQQLCNDK